MTIHYFDSSGGAYDACQCDDEIHTGDVLVIDNEHVVGLADTWPVAVTMNRGQLHTIEGPTIFNTFSKNQVTTALWIARCRQHAVRDVG